MRGIPICCQLGLLLATILFVSTEASVLPHWKRPVRPNHRRRWPVLSSSRSTVPVFAAPSRHAFASTASPTAAVQSVDPYDFENLNLLGKCIAGVVQIGVTVLMEYASGLLGGYMIGSICGVPKLFARDLPLFGLDSKTSFVHQRSVRWARSWAELNAVFGGSRTLCNVVRPQRDEWNTVFSSILAGAYFGRNGGWQSMVQSAVFYGGLSYLLSGTSMRKKPFEYQEQSVEF